MSRSGAIPLHKAGEVQILKYVLQNVAHQEGKTVTLMPTPLVGSTAAVCKCSSRYRKKARRSLHDRGLLKAGGVFTNDVIDAYIALKVKEVTRLRMTTHPVELDTYDSL